MMKSGCQPQSEMISSIPCPSPFEPVSIRQTLFGPSCIFLYWYRWQCNMFSHLSAQVSWLLFSYSYCIFRGFILIVIYCRFHRFFPCLLGICCRLCEGLLSAELIACQRMLISSSAQHISRFSAIPLRKAYLFFSWLPALSLGTCRFLLLLCRLWPHFFHVPQCA